MLEGIQETKLLEGIQETKLLEGIQETKLLEGIQETKLFMKYAHNHIYEKPHSFDILSEISSFLDYPSFRH